jgi:hypothetical protein
VNTYTRPRRTFSTVDDDREPLGQADTVNTRRPVQTERLKLLPGAILAAVLPSSRKLTTKFLPRFGSLETIRRPVDRASAVPIETAYMRARIGTTLHVEMYFEFMISSYARNGFLANVVLIDVWCDTKRNGAKIITGITRFRSNEKQRANQSSPKLKHVPKCHRLTRVPKSFLAGMERMGIERHRRSTPR